RGDGDGHEGSVRAHFARRHQQNQTLLDRTSLPRSEIDTNLLNFCNDFMSFKLLAINPGSTSTKVALFEDERPLLDLTLRHTAEEIAAYANITDQLPWRREIILKALAEQGFDIRELSAVIGRGGLIKPIPAGVYEVNDAMRHDLIHA